MSDEDLVRAADIILGGRYLTLATARENRPWAAPVAYSTHGDGALYFYTGIDTQHFQDFAVSWTAAGAIFNSTLPNADADGVQFVASVAEVGDQDLDEVMDKYLSSQFPSAEDRRAFEAPRTFFVAPARQRFVRLALESVYLPDLAAYDVPDDTPKVDRRIEVSVPGLREILASRVT